MSKGSKSRIGNQKTFNEGWDRIFNKRGNNMSVNNEKEKEGWYESCLSEMGDMTVNEFQNICETEGFKDVVVAIDNAINEIAKRNAEENGE